MYAIYLTLKPVIYKLQIKSIQKIYKDKVDGKFHTVQWKNLDAVKINLSKVQWCTNNVRIYKYRFKNFVQQKYPNINAEVIASFWKVYEASSLFGSRKCKVKNRNDYQNSSPQNENLRDIFF